MSPRAALSIALLLGACVEPYRGVDVRPIPQLARTGPRAPSAQPAELHVRDEVDRLHRAAVTLAYQLAPQLSNHCEVASVASAQAIVVARCESDQLFAPGFYSFRSSGAAAEWGEVGRRLVDILNDPAVGSIEVDVTGSVDEMRCCGSHFDRGAQFLADPTYLLTGVTIDSCRRCLPGTINRSLHDLCNQCLSWSRGFAVAWSIRSLLVPSLPRVKMTARGAGTCWLDHHGAAIGNPGCREAEDCQRARTVDVTIRLLPRVSQCSVSMGDPASTLFCYQEIWRQRAGEVPAVERVVPPSSVPVFTCAEAIEGVESTPGLWRAASTNNLGQAQVSFELPRLP